MELAREYTERWTHQQHIRDAVNQPGLGSCHVWPGAGCVCAGAATNVCELSRAGRLYNHRLHHKREAGRVAAAPEPARWVLYVAETGHPAPTSSVSFDQETAWRLFSPEGSTLRRPMSGGDHHGDRELGLHLLNTVSMLVFECRYRKKASEDIFSGSILTMTRVSLCFCPDG